jgi:hypothetical protein
MNIQTFIDLTHTKKDGLYAFMGFVGAVIFIMIVPYISFMNILSGIVMFSIMAVMYIPIITTIQAVKND